MKNAFDDYTRLCGSHGMRGSLWRGPDHLLVIEGRGFMVPFREHYRRMDYRNIQALTLVRTARWIWLLVSFALGVLVFGAMSFSAWNEILGLGVTFAIPAAGLLVMMVLELIKGPTCRCFIQTTVQVLRLKPLTRTRKAVKVLNDIEQLCREHQGSMPEQFEGQAVAPSAMAADAASVPVATGLPGTQKRRWTGSRWVLGSGLTGTLWGILLMAELFVPGLLFLSVNILTGLLAFVFTIIGLTKVMPYAAPTALKITLWIAVMMQALTGFGMYMAFVASHVVASTSGLNGTENMNFAVLLEHMAAMENTGSWGYGIIAIGAVLTILGLITLITGRVRGAALTPTKPPVVTANETHLPEEDPQ